MDTSVGLASDSGPRVDEASAPLRLDWRRAALAPTVVIAAIAALSVPVAVANASAPTSVGKRIGDDSRRAKASKLFRRGNERMRKRDYKGAVNLYRKARRLYQSRKLDLNIGLACHALGRLPEAAESIERYLSWADRAADTKHIAGAEARLAGLRQRLGRLAITLSGGPGDIVVGKRKIGRTPLLGPVYVAPGKHVVTVTTISGASKSRTVFVAAGSGRKVEFVLGRKQPERTAAVNALGARALAKPRGGQRSQARDSTPVHKKWWFWALVGAAVAGASVGTYAATRPDSSPSRDIEPHYRFHARLAQW